MVNYYMGIADLEHECEMARLIPSPTSIGVEDNTVAEYQKCLTEISEKGFRARMERLYHAI